MGIIKFKKLDENAILPRYMTEDAVGFDFFACLPYSVAILPGKYRMIRFGVAYEIDPGYWLEICGRSSLEVKHKVFCVDNTNRYDELMEAFEKNRLFCAHNGVIEPGYRGELSVLLRNDGQFEYVINPGDRVAQGIIRKRERFDIEWADELSDSERGETGGFGSTGV